MNATQKRLEVAMVTPTTGSTTAPHSGWRQLVPVTVILVACTSASKTSIRRFVITEKAPTRETVESTPV